jgi:phosphate transport system substrate-binding protein
VSYLIACPSYSDSAQGTLVKNYLTYVISSAGQQVGSAAAKSAPLPASLASKASTLVSGIK